MNKAYGKTGMMLGALLLAGALALPVQAAEKLNAAPHKMVIQVSDNDPAKWNLALNNARNIQKDLGKENVALEIIVFGPGIGMLKAESEVGNRVTEAAESGIAVSACQNTMRNQKLNKEDMLTSIGYVSAGVVAIMLKQEQGYTYLRP